MGNQAAVFLKTGHLAVSPEDEKFSSLIACDISPEKAQA
jgi:hypothetical protein